MYPMQPDDHRPDDHRPNSHHNHAWLASLLLRQSDRFMPRLAVGLARLRALPRGYRRRLQRKAAISAAGAALILAMAAGPLFVPSASAATITADGVTCTLVDAIRSANTNAAVGGCASGAAGVDTIELGAGAILTIAAGDYYYSPTGLPLVIEDLIIEGNGFTIERDGAADPFRLLAIGDGISVTIRDATLTGGLSEDSGGGIFAADGVTLTLENSVITGNRAGLDVDPDLDNIESNAGGGIFQAGGDLIILDSDVSGNTANGADCEYDEDAQEIYCFGFRGKGGGIFQDEGDLMLTATTVNDNTAARRGGGVYLLGPTAVIAQSTISGNSATAEGGGLYNEAGEVTITRSTISYNTSIERGGGGIYQNSEEATLDITNSTISNNTADDGGGLYLDDGTTVITNSTITGNSAENDGGGIFVFFSTASLTLNSSIVSGNTAGDEGEEIYNNNGVITADETNLFGHSGSTTADAFEDFTPGATDFIATSDGAFPRALADILDTTLADNGGPTLTHNLVPDSLAIDLSDDGDCVNPPVNGVDQRGFTRPIDLPGVGNDAALFCDIGAVEYTPAVAETSIFMSTTVSGETGDGLDFGPEDIVQWDGTEWSMWFDGSGAGLMPFNAKHNINAFWIPDASADDFVFSFAQNRRFVPGLENPVDGMDLLMWDGAAFSFWFDGSDVGLTNKTAEKIDSLHALDGSESPIGGGSCLSYLLISTQGTGKVPNHSGGTLNFRGEDVLGFCLTNSGSSTTGLWHMVLDGSTQDMPANATTSLSMSEDGNTLYLTTKGTFNVDSAIGGHSMVYEYDLTTTEFSGPIFIAADEGLLKTVDGLQVE